MSPTSDPVIGVLALQGDVEEHLTALASLGVLARPVRRAAELARLDGIVIPGGESTTICRLLDVLDLRTALTGGLQAGLPAFGSCAGMIVLARDILDGRPDQRPLGAIDMVVRRNAFGRQVDSFERSVAVAGLDSPMTGVFIRAPWVEEAGPGVEVLAEVDGHPVAVRQGSVLATAFHPEVGDDLRLHEMFLAMVSGG
ncbi:pyridoxal 5'-phosphate synthase glutaminase subunit PdxT [Nakamurella flavida]|uniref:Pyridoxal 5'-phosphate synthase subunit PdxT n=1 Tax=Nakamurella flavida TaxID=363630 RepID=A0A938YGS8_9ACTN|nr:pyridoxal 5'-phosphate synthase glutaminase subunit PdxT [Nakamurella flavida]MBM9477410.1 pyridoxal 5'-phosphate synthase glutaminase subunit PdxT [Nakamurella flavida]MDP9777343.1 5'-phosphate synthase pdxT subunit [Nakamurella flavida]